VKLQQDLGVGGRAEGRREQHEITGDFRTRGQLRLHFSQLLFHFVVIVYHIVVLRCEQLHVR